MTEAPTTSIAPSTCWRGCAAWMISGRLQTLIESGTTKQRPLRRRDPAVGAHNVAREFSAHEMSDRRQCSSDPIQGAREARAGHTPQKGTVSSAFRRGRAAS
jgi:hypothetical protein